MLIVLDDAHDARQIAPLLPAGRGCAVLITARARLTTPTGSRFIDLDVLDSETASELLVCLVGAQRVEREPEAVTDILTCCAGLPLAIRIVGAKLAGRPGWTLRSVADRLVDQRRRLDELTVGDLAVRACFEISYASLPRPDACRGLDPARVFRLMGLWVGWGISLPAAAALLGIPEADAEDTLEFLVDAHLLESPGPGRYVFHDLLRVYAAERANTEETHDDAQAALDRVLVWYLHTVTAADGLMSPEPCIPLDRPPRLCVPAAFTGYQEAMDWCESEIANFPTIVEFASRTERHTLAWQLAAGLTRFFHHRHHLVDWIGTHRIALASARRSRDQYGEARILRSLGSAHMLRWRHDDALDCYQQALTLSRSIGYGYGESLALTNLGEVYKRMQRYDAAIGCYQQALDKAHADGNLYGEAAASNNLGEIYYLHDRVNEALPPLERAYALFRQIDNHYGEGISLDSIGNVYMLLGRYEEAITHLQQALDVYRGVGDRYHEAMVVLDLGIAFAALKRFYEAETHYRRALNLFQEIGDRNGHARSLRILGELLYDTDRPAAAVEHLHKALDLVDDPNDPVAREIDAILRAM
jgi:tetratricopeptide (TPR) repeat protein